MSEKMNGQGLQDAIYHLGNHGVDRTRPYDGQPHTDQGVRGATLVAGLTFRDVVDCFVIGYTQAAGRGALVDTADFTYNDLYGHEDHDIDPLAIAQNMACEMERRMGIFPNIPEASQ